MSLYLLPRPMARRALSSSHVRRSYLLTVRRELYGAVMIVPFALSYWVVSLWILTGRNRGLPSSAHLLEWVLLLSTGLVVSSLFLAPIVIPRLAATPAKVKQDWTIVLCHPFEVELVPALREELAPVLGAYGMLRHIHKPSEGNVFYQDRMSRDDYLADDRLTDWPDAMWFNDEDWRTHFLDLLSEADLVVVDVSCMSDGVRWELDRSLERMPPGRVVTVANARKWSPRHLISTGNDLSSMGFPRRPIVYGEHRLAFCGGVLRALRVLEVPRSATLTASRVEAFVWYGGGLSTRLLLWSMGLFVSSVLGPLPALFVAAGAILYLVLKARALHVQRRALDA